jgi:hypothetical protein
MADSNAMSSELSCPAPSSIATVQLEPVAPTDSGALDGGPNDAGPLDAASAAPIVGTATFAAVTSGVDLTISITGCAWSGPFGTGYPVRIHEGMDCSVAGVSSADWDTTRGEGISNLSCTGTSGVGLDHYSRSNGDAKPWSVGGAAASNIVGHVLVVHDPNTMQPLACGAIVLGQGPASGDGGAGATGSVKYGVGLLAQLAGLCLFQSFVVADASPDCPDPRKVAACACEHCNLSACIPACSAYSACLAGQADGCASSCSPDPSCESCLNPMSQCMFGFCEDTFQCAPPPTPGGPCTELEACCATQRDGRAPGCLAFVQGIEKLSGDPGCLGTMHDWDFLTNGVNDPPCIFDQ